MQKKGKRIRLSKKKSWSIYLKTLRKQIRGKTTYIATKNNVFTSGVLSLQTMSTGRINSKHIETMFRYITKSIKKKTGYIKKNIILNKTLTKKATGIRMGKGKGEIKDIVCSLNKGDHMFEINMFKKQLTNIRPFISACKRSATLARIIHNYKLQTIRLNSFIQYT